MRKIGVIGLGYVGLGLAISLSEHFSVTGYDLSQTRIHALKEGRDRNNLIDTETLKTSSIQFSAQLQDIKDADFYIVTVSTPALFYELPNLEPLVNATRDLATILKKGDVVVYESTVYPGTTDDVCIPLLEEIGKLQANKDFFVGYSPERINPNDTVHRLKTITKIIAAQNQETLAIIREVYSTICDNVYEVSSIKAAEAVKILENTQRDVNIALMNEFTQIMHALHLDTHEIIEAAKTKWSFLPFKPGFVGGHCIAVDPLYLSFQAKRLGLNPHLIQTARRVNDDITVFVINEFNKLMLTNQISLLNSSIGIFGITYKENIPDIRNSLALKLIKELRVAGIHLQVHDPYADKQIVEKKYGITLKSFEEINELAIAIILVPHTYYLDKGLQAFAGKFTNKKIIMDIPNAFIDQAAHDKDLTYWCL